MEKKPFKFLASEARERAANSSVYRKDVFEVIKGAAEMGLLSTEFSVDSNVHKNVIIGIEETLKDAGYMFSEIEEDGYIIFKINW